jgi:hypothetical protein
MGPNWIAKLTHIIVVMVEFFYSYWGCEHVMSPHNTKKWSFGNSLPRSLNFPFNSQSNLFFLMFKIQEGA